MKAVLISIKPKWCKRIANGQKTIEVRKTRPKMDTPFKCYLYCTYGEGLIEAKDIFLPNHLIGQKVSKHHIWSNCCNGKVIGEFVCDRIEEAHEWELTPSKNHYEFEKERLDLFLEQSCLSYDEICEYRKNLPYFKPLYGWHISDLVIYDKPKSLEMFPTGKIARDCGCGGYMIYDKILTRPPQSWCYVEEKE